jgi:gas vesicle protein
MALATAILGGFVGALIGLLIALLGQSREDERLRRAEEWRQRTAKQERLRKEFATALELVYEVHVATGLFQWVPPSQAAKDPTYEKRRAKLEELYEEANAADILLRLEGATDAWRASQRLSNSTKCFATRC